MKQNQIYSTLAAVLTGLATIFLVSCGSPAPQAAPTEAISAVGGEQIQGLNLAILNEINAYRASHGKRALQGNLELHRLAQEHSEYMGVKYQEGEVADRSAIHQHGFPQRTALLRSKYGMGTVAQNVLRIGARGDIAQRIVAQWKQMEGAKDDMLGDWQAVGIGSFIGKDGMVYATQLFAASGAGW